MGKDKTHLTRGDRYGVLKAAELAAEMIAAYERRRPGATYIRVELQDGDVWDDIAVTRSATSERWQVKRLMEDAEWEQIAQLIASAARTSPEMTFWFGTAEFPLLFEYQAVPGKKNRKRKNLFNLADLAELCQEARKPGLTPDEFRTSLQGRLHSPYDVVKACTVSQSADETLRTLAKLHFVRLGTEEPLLRETAAHLAPFFTNADVLAKQLHQWLTLHPDGAIEVSPQLLYREVIEPFGQRDPAAPYWLHAMRAPTAVHWHTSGPLHIEQLASLLWSPALLTRLVLGSAPLAREATTHSFCRLILHSTTSTLPSARAADEWRTQCNALCGGTLGISDHAPNIAVNTHTDAPTHQHHEQLSDIAFSRTLEEQMDHLLFAQYRDEVTRRLVEDDIGADLRPAMLALWRSWHTVFEQSPEAASNFLLRMLATAHERTRKDIVVSVRAGRQAVDMLARTTVITLAVCASVTLAPSFATKDHNNLTLGLTELHAIALTCASHPLTRLGCRIIDAPGPILADESALTILGTVEDSALDLYTMASEGSVPFHASESDMESLHATGRPLPLLTASSRFRAAMRDGAAAMRVYLSSTLSKMAGAQTKGIIQAINQTGASGGVP